MSRPHVLIAGGGVAGIEALFAVSDLAGERVEITLVAADPEFVYRPLLVEEPFRPDPAERRSLPEIAEAASAEFVLGALERVRTEERTIGLRGGSSLSYDALMVCVGVTPASSKAGTLYQMVDLLFALKKRE